MAKFIKLMKDVPQDSDRPSHWYVLPTATLRDLVCRQLLRKDSRLNYVLFWKDVNGFGLQVAHADWVRDGAVYGWRGDKAQYEQR